MLVTASWVEKVKQVIGLHAVSQVWGEKPAWYFWISQEPGVYHLQLEGASPEKIGGVDLISGIFSVRCYPYQKEQVFQSFSTEERCFIQSHLFDHTNTPRFEHKEKIPETLFNVGTIEYTVDQDDDLVFFVFEGLDAVRISYDREMIQEYTVLEKIGRFKQGDIDRNVPGWDLGFSLFDRLLSLYAFYSKRKPARVLMTRSPGFEYVYDQNHAFQCVDTIDVNINTLIVVFSANGEERDLDINEWGTEKFQDNGQAVIFDRIFQCDHFPRDHDQIPLITTLNEQWWTLAESDYKSELASTCGCESDHHTT